MRCSTSKRRSTSDRTAFETAWRPNMATNELWFVDCKTHAKIARVSDGPLDIAAHPSATIELDGPGAHTIVQFRVGAFFHQEGGTPYQLAGDWVPFNFQRSEERRVG